MQEPFTIAHLVSIQNTLKEMDSVQTVTLIVLYAKQHPLPAQNVILQKVTC